MTSIPFWTAHGAIDLADLQPHDLTAEILADALAKVNRYGGRTREPWPVAGHSVLVEHLCPVDLKPWALLHDAHEAFLGDIVTPAVDLIASVGNLPHFDDALAYVKGQIDRRIASAWGVAVRSLHPALIRADRIALCAEAEVFIGGAIARLEPGDGEDIDRAVTMLLEMRCDWRAARDLWLSRVEHHASLGGISPPAGKTPARPGGAT